ncbi:MAG TPA: MSMEG_0567/Sll0786 family nitrogen starvation N-acetyltransferase [Nakamurella sp.]
MSGIVCRQAISAADRAQHFTIRHRVFVQEQGVFAGSDLDALDEPGRDGSVIRLLGLCDGAVAGTVRLFELDPAGRVWQGDRLAVLEPFRVRGVGAPLVRCAVATAGARGGHRMDAHIQLANVGFFRRLGWAPAGDPELYAGLPHQPMSIGLPAPAEGAATVRALALGVTEAGR